MNERAGCMIKNHSYYEKKHLVTSHIRLNFLTIQAIEMYIFVDFVSRIIWPRSRSVASNSQPFMAHYYRILTVLNLASLSTYIKTRRVYLTGNVWFMKKILSIMWRSVLQIKTHSPKTWYLNKALFYEEKNSYIFLLYIYTQSTIKQWW